jgi:hypothetical protein
MIPHPVVLQDSTGPLSINLERNAPSLCAILAWTWLYASPIGGGDAPAEGSFLTENVKA